MTQRPRILVNALCFTTGGGRTYVVNLLRELTRDARGLSFLWLVADGGPTLPESDDVRVRTVRLPAGRARVVSRVLYEELVVPVIARRYDLLYCVGDIASPFSPRPTLVALRNLNIYDSTFYDTPRLRLLNRLARLGIRRAERVLFPSHAAADLIAPRLSLDRARAVVVHHGVSFESFGEGVRQPSTPPSLFLPAALERHKNIEIAIRGLGAVSDRTAELHLAGGSDTDPEYASSLRRLAADLGLADRVKFLGPLPYREVVVRYRRAAALVFPSLLETFGHPLLEAMALGTPAVAADIPAFRELGGEAARFFPATDPRALAAAIDSVLRDPVENARRVRIGLERVQQFSWRNSVDRLCELVREVLSESRPLPGPLPHGR